MSDDALTNPCEKPSMTFGTAMATVGQVVAGAGAAAGAALLTTALLPADIPMPGMDDGSTIKQFVSNTVGTASIGMGEELSKGIGGAAAMLAGYAGVKALSAYKQGVYDNQVPAEPEGYADRIMLEEIAKKQALVAGRNQVFFGAAQPQQQPQLGG